MEDATTLNLGFARSRKTGPLWTAALMALALFPLAWTMLNSDIGVLRLGTLAYVFSGRYFVDCFAPFNTIHAGFCLDQPTIGKYLFWFAWFSVLTLPCVAAIGVVRDRTTRAERLAFAIPAIVMVVLMLSQLVLPFQLLIQYVHSMGFTPKRVYGLAYIAASFVMLLLIARWALRPGKATAASGLTMMVPVIVAPLLACLFYQEHLGLLALPFQLLSMLVQAERLTPLSVIAVAYVSGSFVMMVLLVLWTLRQRRGQNSEVNVNG